MILNLSSRVYVGKRYVIKVFEPQGMSRIVGSESFIIHHHYPKFAYLKRKFLKALFEYLGVKVLVPEPVRYRGNYLVIEKAEFSNKAVNPKDVEKLRKIYKRAGLSALELLGVPEGLGTRNVGVGKEGKLVLYDVEEVGSAEIWDAKKFLYMSKKIGFTKGKEMINLLEEMGWNVDHYRNLAKDLKGVTVGLMGLNFHLYKEHAASLYTNDLDVVVEKGSLKDVITQLYEAGFRIPKRYKEVLENLEYIDKKAVILEKNNLIVDLRVAKKLPEYRVIEGARVANKSYISSSYLYWYLRKRRICYLFSSALLPSVNIYRKLARVK